VTGAQQQQQTMISGASQNQISLQKPHDLWPPRFFAELSLNLRLALQFCECVLMGTPGAFFLFSAPTSRDVTRDLLCV
jgi:hypothetical protein